MVLLFSMVPISTIWSTSICNIVPEYITPVMATKGVFLCPLYGGSEGKIMVPGYGKLMVSVQWMQE